MSVQGLPPSDYSQILQLLSRSGSVRQQLTDANQQASTGRVAETYGGLGAGARVSLDLRPQIAHQQGWQTNIDSASGRLEVTQSALKGIKDIASNLFAQINTLDGLSPSAASSVASLAGQGLERIAQLLNSKVGDVYVFAGQDTSNPPVPTTNAAALTSALLATPATNAPFSTTLGTTAPTVEVGEGERVQVGLIANKNTLAVSQAPTTGSYIRDIMTALATLTTATNGPTLAATAATARAQLSSGLSAVGLEAGALGNLQADLKSRKEQSATTVTSLQAQVSGAEDVDLAGTLTRVASLQTQLQASYQVIAGLRDLTLSKYL